MKINKLDFTKKVPVDRLKHTIDTEGLKCNKTNVDEMYKELVEQRPEALEGLYTQYRYAGKTAVNIFECIDYPTEMNSKEKFLVHLKRKLNLGSLVVGRELRPGINSEPQVNLIQDLGQAILLQWVSGEKKTVWDGYDEVERMSPTFEYMIIRFGKPIFIELRSGYAAHKKYKMAFQNLLVSESNDIPIINWIPVTKVTEAEAEKISEILNAGLLESEVIGEGCIGRMAVSAAPGIEDLKLQKQYRDMVAGRKYLAQVFHVEYTELESGYSTKVKFRINHNGGFEFMSKVSERIIRKILDVFVDVRYGYLAEDKGREAVS